MTSFSAEQQGFYEAAAACLSQDRLRDLLVALTDIHSPTGAAGEASRFLADHMSAAGMAASYRPMTAASGNVLAERRGSGGGASLLLYAPIDTHLEADETDRPWTGPEVTPDLMPFALAEDDWVYGLGSSNPKAMLATLCEVAKAVVDAGLPLKGDLMLGAADGGMPVTIPARDNAGMSNGIVHLLSRGMAPDFAVIMKPWNVVYHEEPGMGWFRLTVKGSLGYAGVKRGTPGFRNATLDAATVIQELEAWLVAYAERNCSGVIEPQGWIGGVRGGWPERPAFPTAATEIFCDVRINPRTTPGEVRAQFAAFVADLSRRRPELDLDWEMYGSTPGGTTDPGNWIIQAAYRGWEAIEGRPHPTPPMMAGQTDGAILRRLGVPTARIGWPWPPENPPRRIAEGLGGMGATYLPDLMPCARKILHVVVDTLSRDRSEVLGAGAGG